MASMSYWKRVKTIRAHEARKPMDAKAYYGKVRRTRDRWRHKLMLERDGRCMVCDKKHESLDCHEMLPRGRFPRTWGSTANYLLVCRACHSRIQTAPISEQLLRKWLCDPDHFNLATMSKIAGRKILLRDVVAAAKRLM